MVWFLDAFMTHADRSFNKIVHCLLRREVPSMPLIPGADDQFATVQETRAAEFGNRIGFVPDHKLERVKNGIESLMPFSKHVVARESKEIAGRLEHTGEFFDPFGRQKLFSVPISDIVVDIFAPI